MAPVLGGCYQDPSLQAPHGPVSWIWWPSAYTSLKSRFHWEDLKTQFRALAHSHQPSSWSRLWGKEVGDKLVPRPSQLPQSRLTCTEYLLHTRPSIKYHPWVTLYDSYDNPGAGPGTSFISTCENESLERSHSCPGSHTTSKWQRQALNPGNWIPAPTHHTPHVSTSLKCGFSLWWVMVNSSHEFN